VSDGAMGLTLLVVSAGLGTYAWRGVGVWIAGRVDVRSAWFQWVTCVAFAMIAGLVCRVILMPVGVLTGTPLVLRLAGVAVAVLACRAARRNLLVGVLAGAASLPLLMRIA
jgi:branched-subunit amino acid transport protein